MSSDQATTERIEDIERDFAAGLALRDARRQLRLVVCGDDGIAWYGTECPGRLPYRDSPRAAQAWADRVVRYLLHRELLLPHPLHPDLVRFAHDSPLMRSLEARGVGLR